MFGIGYVKKRDQEFICPKCGKKWLGSVGGYNPKKPQENLESFRNFLEHQKSEKCPFCESHEQETEMPKVKEKSMKQEKPKVFTLIMPRITLNDVFLPVKSKLQVDEALAKIRNYRQIYIEWNFKSVDPSGAGTILNFYGKPGTGKTMTAEALAGTLGKKMISLGMSDLESKFMGETAKNIRAAFKCAQKEDALLFFDEADTLLGARLSNVTQGLDNEVNTLRSTMLIELERFEGIVIFATNFEKNYDKAFVSRITQHVCFELPDLDGRRRIWERFLCPEIPVEDERESLLSKLADNSEGLSGREIRTCMRLALPKAIHRCEGKDVKVSWDDFVSAIQDVRTQSSVVGSEVGRTKSESRAALSMLGAKFKNEELNNK